VTAHATPFGAALDGAGRTAFGLWAPSCEQVLLALGSDGAERRPMQRARDGWHTLVAGDAPRGTRYRFVVDGGLAVPDPASRCNPDGVHGASEVVDARSYQWHDGGWRGRPWHEAVVYELHVGTFTAEGTFAAAAARLGDLAALGVTAVELMPVAAFAGERGWGYDGVLLFAPHPRYGTADALKALVDAAHAHGLMVLLDVVYNHFGPEGNYLHAYCPEFFNPAHQTPWGAAINFDGARNAPVRDFYRQNARTWIDEFHFDGLRLDAVHSIRDESPRHIVADIADDLRRLAGGERAVHLVLENERNQSSRLGRDERGVPCEATAQWNDDLHHAAHVLLTGERDGYYRDFAADPAGDFARALAEGFVYQGQPSALRGGAPHGEPSTTLPPSAFVSFLQNHDQVGNRAFGERLSMLADAARIDAALACLLLSPQVPMLFAGEEFAASTPFLFFCDFAGELAEAVSRGRRAEFARFAAFADEAARERIPDPEAVTTFLASKLRWDERDDAAHAARLALVRELLALRRVHLWPRLGGALGAGSHRSAGRAIAVEWMLGDGTRWQLDANFGAAAVVVSDDPGEVVFARGTTREGDGVRLQPAGVRVRRIAGRGL